MKKIKKTIASLLCAAMVLVNVPTLSFADTQMSQTTGGYLNTAETMIDFTVTEAINMSCPGGTSDMDVEDISVKNNGKVGLLNIDSVSLEETNGWTLSDYDTNWAVLNKNAKQFGITVNNANDMYDTPANLGTVRPEAETTLTLSGKTGVSTQNIQNEKAGDITITVSFVDYEDEETINEITYLEVTADTEVLLNTNGLYKVSDSVITTTQLEKSQLSMQLTNGQSKTAKITSDMIYEVTENMLAVKDPMDPDSNVGVVVYKTIEYNGSMYTPGIYIPIDPSEFTSLGISKHIISESTPEVEIQKLTSIEITPDTEVIEKFNGFDLIAYKIFDGYIPYEDILGMPVTITATDGTITKATITQDMLHGDEDGYIIIEQSLGIFLLATRNQQAPDSMGSILYPGTYLSCEPSQLTEVGIAKVVIGNSNNSGDVDYDNTITGDVSGFIYNKDTTILGDYSNLDTQLYKIHNGTMTYEQLLGNTIKITNSDGTTDVITITEDMLTQTESTIAIGGMFAVFLTDDTDPFGAQIPAGIYSTYQFAYFEEMGVTEILVGDLSSYESSDADDKPVLDITAGTPALDETDDEYDKLYKWSNTVLTESQLANMYLRGYDESGATACIPILDSEISEIEAGAFAICNGMFIVINNDYTGDFFTPGIWSYLNPETMLEDNGLTRITIENMLPGFKITQDSVLTKVNEEADAYKVSDGIMSPMQLIGMPIILTFEDGTSTTEYITEDDVGEFTSDSYYVSCYNDMLTLLYLDLPEAGLTAGVYFNVDIISMMKEQGITSITVGYPKEVSSSDSGANKEPLKLTSSSEILETYDYDGLTLYKYSNNVYTAEDVIGSTVAFFDEEGAMLQIVTITEDMIYTESGVVAVNPGFYFIQTDQTTPPLSKGIWSFPKETMEELLGFEYDSIVFTPSVNIEVTSDTEFTETVSVEDDGITIKFGKISEGYYTPEALIGKTFTITATNGLSESAEITEDLATDIGTAIAISEFLISVYEPTKIGPEGEEITLSPGIWSISLETLSLIIGTEMASLTIK